MTAKVIIHPLLVVLSSFIEFIFKPFVRKHRQTPTDQEIFENDARETVREIEERERVVDVVVEIPEESAEFVSIPEIHAPLGICLRKSVMFRTHRGPYLAAKVVGYDDGELILSRNGGPRFRRTITAE